MDEMPLVVEQLALLLTDEYYRVPGILSGMEDRVSEYNGERATRLLSSFESYGGSVDELGALQVHLQAEAGSKGARRR
ncbi:hypothetical protein DNL40_11235 [Xylanimonas oleitrophica]|uniref:Uncharacterized protein n=1 Tax=Xylanimonas oleitrophica TaxID=2607479 RepID=A0A2W5WNW9_9MICO|nr:hypothetical protein [Xylanimonas oleitrophica]PZR52672.1 hypothetical protein DNL40_11235 [Xylanimonas oleitrophica]